MNSQEKLTRFPVYNKRHFNGPILNCPKSCFQYFEVKFEHFLLNLSELNNCCFLKNGSVVCLKNIIHTESEKFIIGQEYLIKESFYTEPCESSELGIYLVSKQGLLNIWNVDQIMCKCFKISYEEKCIVYPLLHII